MKHFWGERVYGFRTNDHRYFIRAFGHGAHVELTSNRRHRFLHAYFTVGGGDGDELAVSFAVPFLFAVWMVYEMPWSWARRLSDHKETGVHWSHGTGYVNVWRHFNDFGRWRQITFWRNEWIMGRNRVTRRRIVPADGSLVGVVDVGWWDGDRYPVTLSVEEMVWRNRFRKRRKVYVEMSVEKGQVAPPFPGKGENSWDQGDDGLYGAGFDVTVEGGVEEALKHFAEVVENYRMRYGNRSWRPQESRAIVEGS